MKQVWFPGVHCDVGGGYPEPECGLSKIALQWMIDEARQAGLMLDTNTVDLILGRRGQGYVPPNPDAYLHNSMTRWWQPVEFVPKPHWDQIQGKSEWQANRSRHRTWPPKPVVHDAAWRRHDGTYAQHLPSDAIRLSEAERQSGLTAQFDAVEGEGPVQLSSVESQRG